MRTARHVTLLSLALVVGACGTRSDRTATLPDDLKRDLAAAATSGGDLATAPQSYQRMRFVSSVEQSRSGRPSKQVAMVHHPARAAVSRRPAPEVASATASAAEPTLADAPTSVAEAPTSVAEAPTPVPTPEAPVEQPAAVQQSTSEPASATSGVGGSGGHGGWGGILGGLIGAVVIRGGIGGVDKCDPRSDGRAHPTVIDRPDFGMPIPTGQPTFPGSRRR